MDDTEHDTHVCHTNTSDWIVRYLLFIILMAPVTLPLLTLLACAVSAVLAALTVTALFAVVFTSAVGRMIVFTCLIFALTLYIVMGILDSYIVITAPPCVDIEDQSSGQPSTNIQASSASNSTMNGIHAAKKIVSVDKTERTQAAVEVWCFGRDCSQQ